MNETTATKAEGPGASLVDLLLAQPRVRVARRLGAGLLLEVELRRVGHPLPVPFVFCYALRPSAGWVLEHVYAGASSATVFDDSSYLFMSDMPSDEQRRHEDTGRSLWRHQPEPGHDPVPVMSAPRGVVSYAAAASTAVAAVWADAEACSLTEDRERQRTATPKGQAAVVAGTDPWARVGHRADGAVLRLVRVPLHPGSADLELLTIPLGQEVQLTGELALTLDGRRCAAGLVRYLHGGHRRHGLLLFPVGDPGHGRAVWPEEEDLTEAVAAPDSSWFACTAERIAAPGQAPHRRVVLVAPDGSQVLSVAPLQDNWLRPQAWAGPDAVLCIGEDDGRRRLWRIPLDGGPAEQMDLVGSVQTVTTTREEALVVRSGINVPPEVVSLPLRRPAARQPGMHQPSGPRLLMAPASAAAPRGRTERLAYRAPDGSTWRSWLCLPESGPGQAMPVLVWCHGGPLLSWTDWSWRWNPWPFVAEGYAVLMPDPPLSLGYGQQAVERGWGHWATEVAPVAAAQIQEALVHPSLDSRRVAVMGASFGGWLALALGTLLPTVRLIVSHAGWADLAAVARASDLYGHWLREYGPVDCSPSYRRETISVAAVDSRARVLLSHGCQDGHVPVGETLALYRSLDALGRDVQLMILPDEGHSIRNPANVAAWYRWVLTACHTIVGTSLQGGNQPHDDDRSTDFTWCTPPKALAPAVK